MLFIYSQRGFGCFLVFKLRSSKQGKYCPFFPKSFGCFSSFCTKVVLLPLGLVAKPLELVLLPLGLVVKPLDFK